MAGKKPGVDSTGTQTQRPAKLACAENVNRPSGPARQAGAEIKQKKNGAGTGAARGRAGVGMPRGNGVGPIQVAHINTYIAINENK